MRKIISEECREKVKTLSTEKPTKIENRCYATVPMVETNKENNSFKLLFALLDEHQATDLEKRNIQVTKKKLTFLKIGPKTHHTN